MKLESILESIIFVSGDEGINLKNLCEVLDKKEDEILKIIDLIKEEYNKDNHGVSLELLGGNYKFVTKKECHEYLEKLVEVEENGILSQSALETLAIIAYNEPITRIQIDEIRGVNSSYVLKKLLFKDLIKEVGRSDLPGKPFLYATTPKFLDYFGLSSIDELPKIEIEESKEEDETNLFESKYKENV